MTTTAEEHPMPDPTALLTELLDALHDEALDTNDNLNRCRNLIATHPMGHRARAQAERWLMGHDFFGAVQPCGS